MSFLQTLPNCAPALKIFKSCCILQVLEAGSYRIKICGATLATFKIFGDVLDNISPSESSVDCATIGLGYRSGTNEILDGLQARKLLSGFSGLKHLGLASWIVKALSCTRGTGLPLPRFNGLKQLKVDLVGLRLSEAFLELLHAAPSLETLILDMRFWLDPFGKYDLDCVPPCVKEVEFIGFCGCAKQVLLAEYFLKNACKLKKMLGLVREKFLEIPRNSFWVNGDLEEYF